MISGNLSRQELAEKEAKFKVGEAVLALPPRHVPPSVSTQPAGQL